MSNRFHYPISNILFILLISIICLFYFIYFQFLIPNKFIADSWNVMQGIINPNSVDKSYKNVAIIFEFFGIKSNSLDIYIHFISWCVFQLFLFIILKINKNKKFSMIQMLFIVFFTIMYGIYFNTLSKDLILIMFLLLFLNFYVNNNNFILIILFIGMYTYFFREYWIIIFIFALFINIIKKFKIKKIIFYIICFFIITIIIYDILNNNFITNARVSVNAIRIGGENTRSIINNILPNTNIINDIFNYLYVLVSLIIPLQGFPSSNVVIYYFWILVLIYLIIKHKSELNIKILLLLISYINMQALFEPDFGSAFRHQLALFPLIYYLLNNIKVKEK